MLTDPYNVPLTGELALYELPALEVNVGDLVVAKGESVIVEAIRVGTSVVHFVGGRGTTIEVPISSTVEVS